MEYYSDLIIEAAKSSVNTARLNKKCWQDGDISCHSFDVCDTALAKECGRAVGRYYAFEGNDDGKISSSIAKAIKTELGDATKVMLVGLGNPSLIADKLGTAVLDKVELTNALCKLYPLCDALTNISSFEMLMSLVSSVKPDCIITIDTLATSSPSRLGASYQLTTAGVTPGGGVNNTQPTISSDSVGVKVLALGVPLILSSKLLTKECNSLFLTVANVDEVVSSSAKVLANSINRAFERACCNAR